MASWSPWEDVMPFPQVTVAQMRSWGAGLALAWAGLPSPCHCLQNAPPQVNCWERLLVQLSSVQFLCRHLLLSSVFPSIRVFSSESALRIRWPKYWSFSFSFSPSSEYSGLISFRKALSTPALGQTEPESARRAHTAELHRSALSVPHIQSVPHERPLSALPLLPRPGGQVGTPSPAHTPPAFGLSGRLHSALAAPGPARLTRAEGARRPEGSGNLPGHAHPSWQHAAPHFHGHVSCAQWLHPRRMVLTFALCGSPPCSRPLDCLETPPPRRVPCLHPCTLSETTPSAPRACTGRSCTLGRLGATVGTSPAPLGFLLLLCPPLPPNTLDLVAH